MDSKVSINMFAETCTNKRIQAKKSLKAYPFRIVLNRWSFENWLRRSELNYYAIACYLKIPKQQLIYKLKNGKSFSERQIRELTYLMGAKAMFFAIYFPTRTERKRVFRETFGYELYEKKCKRQRKRIIWTK